MAPEDDKRKVERLEDAKERLDEQRWSDLFAGMSELKASNVRIETQCQTCQQTLGEHQALLMGDPHAGTSGLASCVKEMRTAMFGTQASNENSLVHEVAVLKVKQQATQAKTNLMWKGVLLTAGTAVAALIKTIWKGP